MKFKCLLIILLTFLVPINAIGDDESQFYEDYYSKNLQGWKGIVFICSYDSDDSVLESVCQRAKADIELLAASNKIEIKIAKPNDFRVSAFLSAHDKLITLAYELTATKTNEATTVKAIHARLTYKIFFSNAVEKGSKTNSIDNIPRSGDLEIWSKSAIGSGSPNELIHPFSDSVETLLKMAMTLFLKYSN